jgi:hypothetical protein
MSNSKPAPEDMTHIDLSLAINYLPAVACILKTILMAATLAIVRPEHALPGFALFGLLLNFDRVVSGDRIFNGNAILCMVLLSWLVNFLRLGAQSPQQATNALALAWGGLALCLTVEPAKLKPLITPDGWGETTRVDPSPNRWNFKRLAPTILNTLFVGAVLFTHMGEETGSFKIARSLSFAILSVGWVYIVGVWQRCGQSHMPVFTQNLLARFCPLLFIPPLLSVCFMFASVMALVSLYVDLHCGGFKAWFPSPPAAPEAEPMLESRESYGEIGFFHAYEGSSRTSGISEEPTHWPCAHTTAPMGDLNGGYPDSIREEPDEDLEACFRAACQAKGQ